MPSFIPNQMQGSVSTTVTAITTATVLLEWGHFINSSTNLLVADGGVQVTSGAAATVVLTLNQDGVAIDTRTLILAAAGGDTIAFGSRQQNLGVGHHVYTVTASTTVGTASADDRNGLTISGPAS